MGVEPKIGWFLPTKSSNFNRVFHHKPSILGGVSPYFWKHPNMCHDPSGLFVPLRFFVMTGMLV